MPVDEIITLLEAEARSINSRFPPDSKPPIKVSADDILAIASAYWELLAKVERYKNTPHRR